MAAASSGASNEELASGRIAEQEERLRTLTKQREDSFAAKVDAKGFPPCAKRGRCRVIRDEGS